MRCLLRTSVRRALSTVAPHYVTTPIFYVNAAPHIGHLYSMVFADTAHRWALLQERPAVLSTGTDEHGSKVLDAATKSGSEPLDFVNEFSAVFRQLADAANVDYTRFVRTTDPDHVDRCRAFWHLLDERGFIYKGQHSGWYCVSDETFYTETEIEQTPDGPIARVSKHKVEWREEENYFFRLSKLQQQLVSYYSENRSFVLPENRHRQLLNELRSEPLNDLSISRPRERCAWGITVPSDPTHTMYVWFDALINYYTVAQSRRGQLSCWPANAHIVGKDIMRFHCIYWPAFLIAAGISLPKHVVVHSHWTIEGTKMSKSLKNVVDPFKEISKYGVDSVRYFLMHDAQLDKDTPFSEKRIVKLHNVNLVNKISNLIARVCGQRFDIPSAIAQYAGNPCPAPEDWKHSKIHKELVATLQALPSVLHDLVNKYEFSKAMLRLTDAVMLANQYFQDTEPWKDCKHRSVVLYTTAECCRIVAILLQPTCPDYANRMLTRLAVSSYCRTFADAKLGSDHHYGQGANRQGDHPLQRLKIKVEA